jgi:transcriptional regulator with XRE-family HTH domain
MGRMPLQKREVGARIKAARAAKGWKQKHLAAQVRVEPITVSRWERGATTPDFDGLALIAEATGKPLSYFLGEEPSASQETPPRRDAPMDDAVARVEAAAERIASESERIAAALSELRAELARLR